MNSLSRRAMATKPKILFLSLLLLVTAANAGAQNGPVSFKPHLKPGQENRYQITASVHTVVTPNGATGIASDVHRELAATIMVRTGVSEKGGVVHEAAIESINFRAAIDGVDGPSNVASLVGQKIEFVLDDSGRLAKCSMPEKAVDAGLAELIFSLTSWIPNTEVAVGQSWGQADGNVSAGEYGYISTTKIADISK